MLYSEIIAFCSEIHTKHINTLCGQNVGFLLFNLVVYIVTTALWKAIKIIKITVYCDQLTNDS
jgi:hypothetical protein